MEISIVVRRHFWNEYVCRGHIQTHARERKNTISTLKSFPLGLVDNKLSMVVMAWRQIGDKALSKAMVTKIHVKPNGLNDVNPESVN